MFPLRSSEKNEYQDLCDRVKDVEEWKKVGESGIRDAILSWRYYRLRGGGWADPLKLTSNPPGEDVYTTPALAYSALTCSVIFGGLAPTSFEHVKFPTYLASKAFYGNLDMLERIKVLTIVYATAHLWNLHTQYGRRFGFTVIPIPDFD